jgi:hypothetical protein
MGDYGTDREWSDRFLPKVKAILGQHLIGAAPEEEDRKRNTDLIVLRMNPVRIAVRMRDPYYYRAPWSEQFTIRTERPNGCKTELRKIIERWGDLFFYGFAGTMGEVHAYTIVDLRLFRGWFTKTLSILMPGEYPGEHLRNPDGTRFRSFNLSDLGPEAVVAKYRGPLGPNVSNTETRGHVHYDQTRRTHGTSSRLPAVQGSEAVL